MPQYTRPYTEGMLARINQYLSHHMRLVNLTSVVHQRKIDYALDENGGADVEASDDDIVEALTIELFIYDRVNADARAMHKRAHGVHHTFTLPENVTHNEGFADIVDALVSADLPQHADDIALALDELHSKYAQERERGANVTVGLRHGVLSAEVNSPLDDVAGVEVKFEGGTVALIEETADGRGVRVLSYVEGNEEPIETIAVSHANKPKE